MYNLIAGVNETRSSVQLELCECKCVNEGVYNSFQKWNYDECWSECKKLNVWGSCINDYIQNPSACDCECHTGCKFGEYLDIENCSCEKCLFDKLVLTCEYEILNTTETPLNNKIAIFENNCLIHTISLVIICLLLLAVVSISYH